MIFNGRYPGRFKDHRQILYINHLLEFVVTRAGKLSQGANFFKKL